MARDFNDARLASSRHSNYNILLNSLTSQSKRRLFPFQIVPLIDKSGKLFLERSEIVGFVPSTSVMRAHYSRVSISCHHI